ncbi:MAG: nuclear transport factor 2 family protein [Rhodanobacteraceae bacterium]
MTRLGFRHAAAAFTLTTLLACASTQAASSNDDRAAVTAHVREFLDAYAADNQQAALRLIDPRQFTMFGSDAAEIAHGATGLQRFLNDDFHLWHTAHFGPIEHLDLRIGAQYASAFFDVPFSAAGAAPLTLRVSTVWHKVNGVWMLTQSSNCVPTTGSSAREILNKQLPARR